MRPLCLLLLCFLPLSAAAAPAPAAVQAFLQSNAHAQGVTVRPSGLQTRVIKSGRGRPVGPRDAVQIYYTAKLADGHVVDGTSPGLPAPVDLSHTLPGLGEALQQMREGDHWELALPPALAFGTKGKGADIPPGQALIFDVTVATVTPAAAGGGGVQNGFSVAAGNGESHAYYTIHP
ncbi:MAG: FKBP-type peptidyl-prolyl cis-trans isomerase [Alphaproteobacteria bacterium]|nr:FKBP-type peptidyl-prolyl cis-trans isomerase [Alphaproteobacteria bacterium]